MNVRHFVNQQFWAGVALTAVVGILAVGSMPNFLGSRAPLAGFHGTDAQELTQLVPANAMAVKRMGLTHSFADPQDRKMLTTVSMGMLVKKPRDTSEKIRFLVEHTGGFLVNSEIYGGGAGASSASLTVRVQTDKFEEVRTQIRSLGLRMENEKLDAQDVTTRYVDESARLRNLRAQETQYLGILKQARTVKDTLEVSDKLDQVREEIEQQQAEFDSLSKQVETVALSITLRSEEEAQVFGLQWRPLYQLKVAARQGLDHIADYTAAMATFLFFLPAAVLWLATILVVAATIWRIFRWAVRTLFVRQNATSA